MNIVINIAWAALLLIHVAPAAALFSQGLLQTLYSVNADRELSVLLRHRGALFLAVVVACGFALIDPASRRVASVVVALSLMGYLWLYAEAGMPRGSLRSVAIVDLVALAPLMLVLIDAWRPRVAGA